MRLRETPEIHLLIWGGLFNGLWEFLHSPLYADHARGLWYIIWTRLHCTVGDLMILLASFWITSLVFRTRFWVNMPISAACLLFLSIGFGYTAFSEWYNTTVARTWEYAATMPVALGIGLSPLMQWLVVPPLAVLLTRRRLRVGDIQTHSPTDER